jgi:hypothetical protein
MIRKSGDRFSEKIMLKQIDEIMMRNRIMIEDLMTTRPVVSQVCA